MALALIFRLVVIFDSERPAPRIAQESNFAPDSGDYYQHSKNLLEGRGYGFGYPTITRAWYRAPGYPIFLYLIFRFIAHSFLAVKIIQSVVDTFTVLLVYLTARTFFLRTKVSLCSGFIYALYPYAILHTADILTECLFSFFYVLSNLLILKIVIKNKGGAHHFFAGLFLAIAALIRSTLVLFLIFLMVYLFFRLKGEKKSRAYLGILFVGFLVPVMPWIIYTFAATGRFIPISTTGVAGFWAVHTEYGTSYAFLKPASLAARVVFFDQFQSQDSSAWFLKDACRFILDHPVLVLKTKCYGFLHFWQMVPKVAGHSFFRILLNCFSVSVVPIAGLLGLFMAAKKKMSGVSYLLAVFIFFTVIHVIIVGIARYRVPLIDPYLIIFCSYLFWQVCDSMTIRSLNKKSLCA